MLILVHGEDIQNSYLELQNVIGKYQDFTKQRLSAESSQLAYQALFTTNMFETKKVTIGEDLISNKLINPNDLNKLSAGDIVILWEKKELPPSTLNLLPKETVIKLFKPNPILFKFLDSIGTGSNNQQTLLGKLGDSKVSLTWQIENRLFLLILIKLGYSAKKISDISKKPLQNWQMEKLQYQARALNLATLKRLFSSTLKIETIIKSGQTNQDEKSLISLMLFRHFSN